MTHFTSLRPMRPLCERLATYRHYQRGVVGVRFSQEVQALAQDC